VRTEAVTIPAARAASPSLSDVYGFTLDPAPGAASPAAFPVSASVEYEDNRTEDLVVREGRSYSSGVKMRRVYFWAHPSGGAGGALADVARHLADLIVPASRQDPTFSEITQTMLIPAAGSIDFARPSWATRGALFYHSTGNITGAPTFRPSYVNADGSVQGLLNGDSVFVGAFVAQKLYILMGVGGVTEGASERAPTWNICFLPALSLRLETVTAGAGSGGASEVFTCQWSR